MSGRVSCRQGPAVAAGVGTLSATARRPSARQFAAVSRSQFGAVRRAAATNLHQRRRCCVNLAAELCPFCRCCTGFAAQMPSPASHFVDSAARQAGNKNVFARRLSVSISQTDSADNSIVLGRGDIDDAKMRRCTSAVLHPAVNCS